MRLYSIDEESDPELMLISKEWKHYSFFQKLKVNFKRPIFLIYFVLLISILNLFICYFLYVMGV